MKADEEPFNLLYLHPSLLPGPMSGINGGIMDLICQFGIVEKEGGYIALL